MYDKKYNLQAQFQLNFEQSLLLFTLNISISYLIEWEKGTRKNASASSNLKKCEEIYIGDKNKNSAINALPLRFFVLFSLQCITLPHSSEPVDEKYFS